MTRQVFCGGVPIGGGAPVSIQSMLNVDVRDTTQASAQLLSLAKAGAEIVRVAVPDTESAEAFGKIRRNSPVPLVADIHFDYRLALLAIENGADKVRINPGNIGGPERVRAVVKAAKDERYPFGLGLTQARLKRNCFRNTVVLQQRDFVRAR